MAFLTVHFIAFPPGVGTFFVAASPDRPLVMTRIWVSKSQAWNQRIFFLFVAGCDGQLKRNL